MDAREVLNKLLILGLFHKALPRLKYLSLVVLCACSAEPHLIGVAPEPPVSREVLAENEVRIVVATTRARSDEEGVFFSGERSAQLSFATINVSIPPAHQIGRVELPRSPPPNAQRHLILHEETLLSGADAFVKEIRAELRKRPPGSRSALMFVHGYNTNLTEAVARFAQFVEDSGFQGVPILFSWPSRRRTIDYVADINSAAISRDGLADVSALLETIGSDVESTSILAHSMGNFLTMEAMRTIGLSQQIARINRIDNVILSAPDIDIQLFESQLGVLPEAERRKIVILLSRDDKALRIAKRIAGDIPRIGSADPETLAQLGVNVVDLTEINDTNSINHSKFANSPIIVQTIGASLAETDTLSTSQTATGIAIQKAGEIVQIF